MTTQDEIKQVLRPMPSRMAVRKAYNTFVVVVWWDDLSPEPERTENKRNLRKAKRTLEDNGFETSDIQSQYGQAKFRVE